MSLCAFYFILLSLRRLKPRAFERGEGCLKVKQKNKILHLGNVLRRSCRQSRKIQTFPVLLQGIIFWSFWSSVSYLFVFPTMLSTKFQLTKFKFIVQFIRFLPNASNNLSSPLLCRESRCELQILANDKLAQCSTVSQSVLHFPSMFYSFLQCSTIIGIVLRFLDFPKIFYNSLHYSLISHNVLQFYYILQLPQYSTIPYSVLQFPTTFYNSLKCSIIFYWQMINLSKFCKVK